MSRRSVAALTTLCMTSGSRGAADAVASTSDSATQGQSKSPRSSSSPPISYKSTSITVGEVQVPVAIWYPAAPVELDSSTAQQPIRAQRPYEYKIGIGRLFKAFLGFKLPVPSPQTNLAGSGDVLRDAAPLSTTSSPTIIFAHGYLGSRFDALTLCETLARQGFTVAAPDFAESIMGNFEPDGEVTSRGNIMIQLQALLREDFGATQFGVMGHSAGGGTATMTPGTFALGRCAIAGARLYTGSDPVFLVASSGDGVIPLDRVEQAVPPGVTTVGSAADLDWALVSSAALFLDRPLPGESLPPNHLSFLDEETNSVLVNYLSPLLPLANLLGLSVLDFGVYKRQRDSESCAKAYRPAVVEFFLANRGRAM
eukprot:CAMPEP_0197844508 /NCGR_PEP_ID=MMETSP1438-20131217/1496_1 /TAXON_ID=1461541 /ORGANISM="Pterosperma sp., Strain CCMP1384" /LENGTH=368 /DNA_ID=CAMNT_0043455331 /DNA_START=320 /DNA_END=1426 /DNA_ORIENTATION=+